MIRFSKDTRFGYMRAEVTISTGQTSDPVLVDVIYNAITVALITSGEAYLEYSVCDTALLEGGGGHWFKWDAGNVSSNTVDTVFGVITAIRVTSVSGAATLKAVSK